MGGQTRPWSARPFGRLGALALLLAALVPGLLVADSEAGPLVTAKRPNVVVIMTDDQTVESMRVMANVNRMLVRKGTTFANSFATFPLCCPSRATFLTGQYSHNHGVVGNNYANGLARLDQTNTLPVWLQTAGYETVFVGKYLNEYGRNQPRAIPPGWSEWYAGLRMTYFDHTMNRKGRIVRYGHDELSYQSDVYARTAVDVLRRHAQGPKPLFLWLSFFAPHVGTPREADDPVGLATTVPAPRHRDRFGAEALPLSAAFGEADATDKPNAIRSRKPLVAEDVAPLQEAYQQRLESLLAVDEAVAAVVDELRAAGVLNRTIIVFTSDNGFLMGEHRVRSGKELVYEPSIRVPLVVRGPGVPVRRVLEQPVANIDLAPTIAALARATPGRVVDGRSLLPLFADPGIEWGRDLLIERGPGAVGIGPRLVTAIKTPRYLYAAHSTGELELYDLERDPLELDSLHADEEHTLVQSELARRLTTLQDCSGSSCWIRPAVSLSVTTGAGCVRTAQVSGPDEGAVEDVELLVDGAVVARDQRGPFTPSAIVPGATKLRALAVFADGRRLTLDAPLAACG
jgi:N-acetylglucosamine-6-sulfatase